MDNPLFFTMALCAIIILDAFFWNLERVEMSDTKIKDMFFVIPIKWVLDNDFKGGEFRLLLYIFSIADSEGEINKTIGMLADTMQEKESVILKYLKQLSELNYISVTPERANSYDLYRKIKILKLFED